MPRVTTTTHYSYLQYLAMGHCYTIQLLTIPCQCTTSYCRRDTQWPAMLLLVVLLGGGLDRVVGAEVVPGVGLPV